MIFNYTVKNGLKIQEHGDINPPCSSFYVYLPLVRLTVNDAEQMTIE
jgi:hypothetical protein